MDEINDDIEMDIALGEGQRRLPIYLLLDTSSSMEGGSIEAVQSGVELFKEELNSDTFAKETVHVGVITFGEEIKFVTNGLIPVDQFEIPDLKAYGLTPLGGALRVLQKSFDDDVKPAVKGKQKGDWKPLVFILTDGGPTDEWKGIRQEIIDRKEKKPANIITVGCGNGINENTLKEIAIGPSFKMSADQKSFKEFFQWITMTVSSVTKTLNKPEGDHVDDTPVDLPPPPSGLQYIP